VSKRLEERGEPAEEVATFLTRILFAMFAEDVSLLPENAFKGLLDRCMKSPNTAASYLSDLFEKMDTGGFSAGLGETVRRFNGAFYKGAHASPGPPWRGPSKPAISWARSWRRPSWRRPGRRTRAVRYLRSRGPGRGVVHDGIDRRPVQGQGRRHRHPPPA
jgi:hypothetical protein